MSSFRYRAQKLLLKLKYLRSRISSLREYHNCRLDQTCRRKVGSRVGAGGGSMAMSHGMVNSCLGMLRSLLIETKRPAYCAMGLQTAIISI